jgi:CRP/FNR family cyclic AMP-dependent transcriptional regulator
MKIQNHMTCVADEGDPGTLPCRFRIDILPTEGMIATIPAATTEKIRLFSGLSPQQSAWVSARLHTHSFPPGADLIIAGTPGEAVYFILNGTVKVYVPQLDGREVTVNLMGPGDTVGELSVIDAASRSASVITLEDTRVAWMSRSDFLEAIRTIPPLSDNLLRTLSTRLRNTTEHIQAYASLDIPGRIARQILVISANYGQQQEEGLYIPLRLTQNDIAELVGASRKRVNQVIVALKREGVISIDLRWHITVHRRDVLEKMAIRA